MCGCLGIILALVIIIWSQFNVVGLGLGLLVMLAGAMASGYVGR